MFGKENHIIARKASMLICVDTGLFFACVYSPFLSHFSPKKERDNSFSKRIRVTFLNTAENPPSPLELSQKVDGGVTSVSVVPTGLWVCGASIPSDESLGYYRKSLRDKAFA